MTNKTDPNLFKTLATYVHTAVDVLRDLVARGDQLPARQEFRYTYTRDGAQGTAVNVPEWSLIAQLAHDRVAERAETQSALRAVVESPITAGHANELVGSTVGAMKLEPRDIIVRLLLRYLILNGKLVFEDASFSKVYDEMVAAFEGSTVTLESVVQLKGFRSTEALIDLGASLAIRRLTPAEQARFERMPMMTAGGGYIPPEFGIADAWTLPKLVGSSPSADANIRHGHERMKSVIDALRLYKAGMVGAEFITTTIREWVFAIGIVGSPSESTSRGHGTAYELSGEDLAQFREFWAWFEKSRFGDDPTASTAIRRLRFGYDRPRLEDRVLDYVIALEALLLNNSERQELSYRLSLRLAALIGRNEQDRVEIFERMRKAYGIRSAVAHGEAIEGVLQKASIHENATTYVDGMEGDVRATLRRYMELEPAERRQLTKYLDERILSGRFQSTDGKDAYLGNDEAETS